MQAKKNFTDLIAIMDTLREQCPWDKKQTIQTLRSLTLEETYELAESILQENWQGIKEELGDVLLHLIFYAKLAAEKNEFDIYDVIDGLCKKLITRHPHIYGNITVKDDEEVMRNWEKIKKAEGRKSALGGVPQALPALVKAMRMQEKAKKVGFDWDKKEDVWDKVQEELAELQEAIEEKNLPHIEEEFGDVFFALTNYARFFSIDSETALERTNHKFLHRFQIMEQLAENNQKNLSAMSLEEMTGLYNRAKKILQNPAP